MKCICGYECKMNETNTHWTSTPFIRLLGSDTYFQVPAKPQSFQRRNVELYACPKCGTIKTEI